MPDNQIFLVVMVMLHQFSTLMVAATNQMKSTMLMQVPVRFLMWIQGKKSHQKVQT